MSPKYEPPVYQIPPNPSRQLKVVLDYFNFLKNWDLETLSQLSTPYFTQVTLPASMGVPIRSKSEDIEFLHHFRDSLKGVPLELIIYDVNENKGKIWVHVRPLTQQGLSHTDYLVCFVQLMMKTVNVECFFLFTFGTSNDENLITNVTEFVDSKVFSGGDGGGGGDAPETPFQTLSSSVQNCAKAMGRCYVDLLLFVPRNFKYVMTQVNH
ncbi:hypothetical protein BJV77DRAFT_995991, partial [Russula vinacea]